jgi:hypothetical protein
MAHGRDPDTLGTSFSVEVDVSRRTFAVCFVVGLAAACASSTGGGSAPGATPASSRRDRNLITREELSEDASMSAQSVLDAIRSLRPQYLMERGKNSHSDEEAGRVHASIDGGRIIPLAELEHIHVNSVLDIRYLDAAAAMQKFGGAAHEGPVILVRTAGKT